MSGNLMGGTLLATVDDCKVYSGTIDMSQTYRYSQDFCFRCKSNRYLNVSVKNFNNYTMTCDKDWGTGCTRKIENCLQQVCFNGPSLDTQGCRICEKGYVPVGYDSINETGSASC